MFIDIESVNFWEQCYKEGITRWDLGEPAPPLVSLLKSKQAPLPGRAAILGCGRGYEAILFAAHGFEVLGFDFAPSAIADASRLAEKSGSSAKFLQRNIFDLPEEFPSYFDYVIEHTCFCAIPPSRRWDYVRVARAILRPGGELIGLFFTHSRPGGPPFGVTPEEIREYFIPDFEILCLIPATNSILSRQGEEHFARFRRK